MSRPNPLILLAILMVTLVGSAWFGLRPGALLISAHEGDTYHLLDILFRMEQGLVPHNDFMTPLGILSFLPIELFLTRGFGIGQAILWSQVLVASALFPAIFYTAWSRLTPKTGYFFGWLTVTLVLALSFGGSEPGLSISMHYNRWAWAIGFVVILLAFAPARGREMPVIDGLLLGLGLSLFVFLKVTFFVALLPGIALILLLKKRWTVITTAVVTGALAALVALYLAGFEFCLRYIGDLLTVSGSEVRPHAGTPFVELLSQSSTIATTAVGLIIYILISRAGHLEEAFGLLLLLPGCFFITYQNFGNDPKWLVPMIALMLVLRPQPGDRVVYGMDIHTGLTAISTAAILLFMPSAMTLAMSPLRHSAQDITKYEPMLPALPAHADIMVRSDRAKTMTAQVELDLPGSPWFKYRDVAGRTEPESLFGVPLPACELKAGTLAWFNEISADLVKADLPSKSQLFVTDIIAGFWLFGDFAPLQDGAPWYYGNLSGMENADYVLAPKCGFVPRARTLMLDELEASEFLLSPIRDNELYVLFAVTQP
ncbi:MAG: hypothetical protein KJO30_06910 [Boseongicola sp.]|nr:hypothetical protein [Boseongicola sp.]NNJ69158.1 hypothetical protein [Boseongicola sp.]